MPPMNELANRRGHRLPFVSAHLRKKLHAPPFRRHSSFHTGPIFMTGALLGKPQHARQVSFDLESPPKYSSTPKTRRSWSPSCPFSLKEFGESPYESSHQSSVDSETLVSTSPPTGVDGLPIQCHNAKCECHSSIPITPLDLDVRPVLSYPSSPRPLLGKRLPSMRNAFSSKRKTKSSVSTPSMAEVEPATRSELLCSSLDSPNITAASIARSNSRLGTDNSTSESYRSIFVRPFMPSRSKTIAVSPRACRSQKFYTRLANAIIF
jgi:hypothetical protein